MRKIFLILGILYSQLAASELIELTMVTNKILMLCFTDGYVEHYKLGGNDNDDVIHDEPLNISAALNKNIYTLTSSDDPNYSSGKFPQKLGRKSKGSDFTRNWALGLPYVSDHNVYLEFEQPFAFGKTYVLKTRNLATNVSEIQFTFDEKGLRSETIHVNQIGYHPDAGYKFAYLSHYMGSMGRLSLDDYEGTVFHVVDANTESIEFSGTIKLRKDYETGGPDTAWEEHMPNGNFTGADVWECDFSKFTKSGDYKIVVEGIGCSYPFKISRDVYREAFITTVRGLYHQRCGTALEAPYTEWTKARCHHPAETDTVILSTWRYMDGVNAFQELPATATNEKHPYWGGWHDAADWDRHHKHLDASKQLLMVYELAPENFSDGEQNIPESGNGIPDIIDEAKWGVDHYKRLQEEDGGVHGGIETHRHPGEGISSVTDDDQWYAYAKEPIASYHYAGVACQLAFCLKLAGHEEYFDEYVTSAQKAYDWAKANTKPADESNELRDNRQFAAAWLFKVTGNILYETRFIADNVITTTTTDLSVWDSHEQEWAVWVYLTTNQTVQNMGTRVLLRQAAINWAEKNNIETANNRGYRFGYNWWLPSRVGAVTTPHVMPLIMAYHLTKDKKYLDYARMGCDYVLGGNPLNMCWVPGIGERYPQEYMHLDSWFYNTELGMVPGIIPYGPYNYESGAGAGPWDFKWALNTTYPDASKWPAHELWFENRYCPITNEFTVHQTIGPAAAAFGYLCDTSTDEDNTPSSTSNMNFSLQSNYPNPFNEKTVIEYKLESDAHVVLAIYDVLGRRVIVLEDRFKEKGSYKIEWDGKTASQNNTATGIYYAQLSVGGKVKREKMLLLK